MENLYSLVKNHLKGNKCPICNKEKITSNTSEFLNKVKKVHKNLYDYSKSNYVNAHTKIEIICPKHGPFFQTPNNHLRGQGCDKCKNEKTKYRCKTKTVNFIKNSNIKHNNGYDYSKLNYINNHTDVEIICKKHGSFFQKPMVHLYFGCGCPKCVNIISKSELEFLNYLKIPNTKENRQIYIKPYKIDGYDDKTNTIYEFFGDYWHGNPKIFSKNNINCNVKKTFGELHKNTFRRLDNLKSRGYNIKWIWESDWNKFRNKIHKSLKIHHL